jgi:hypothetical protein
LVLATTCGCGDERTRVFAESFLDEEKSEIVSAHGYCERERAHTSATSKIFLNCMFAFTFTVTSVYKNAHFRPQNQLALRETESKTGRTYTRMVDDKIELGFRIFWFRHRDVTGRRGERGKPGCVAGVAGVGVKGVVCACLCRHMPIGVRVEARVDSFH